MGEAFRTNGKLVQFRYTKYISLAKVVLASWVHTIGILRARLQIIIGHTQFLMTQCREAANRLTDPALRRQAMELVNANQKLFTQFYNLV